MRMFNRKGVSEVVANVLIVLLVIVGVAVIWAVVKPTIQKASDTVQSDCFIVQVEPQSCVRSGANYNVTVKRNPGAGSFENVELVFSDGTNTARVASNPAVTSEILQELATKTISVSLPASFTAPATSVNVVLKTNGQLCAMTALPVNCA